MFFNAFFEKEIILFIALDFGTSLSALLQTNGFFILYLLPPATVAGHKTLQRLMLQHQHGQKISLDYLVGFADYELDNSLTQKILDIKKLNDEDRKDTIKTIDAMQKQGRLTHNNNTKATGSFNNQWLLYFDLLNPRLKLVYLFFKRIYFGF